MIKVREKKLDFVHQRNSQFKSVPLGVNFQRFSTPYPEVA